MKLFDVNVLVYAFREDSPNHHRYNHWLTETIHSHESFGMSELVLSGFIRIVTHPRIFDPPTPLKDALEFVTVIRNHSNCIIVNTGTRHWDIFTRLCREAGAMGNRIPDAYHAALAVESGSEWITTDKGFHRFKGLKWKHPLGG